MRTVGSMALACVLAAPRTAHAAPAPASPEHWATVGFEAFDEGVKLRQRGAQEEAERKFRAAAEAYVAAFEAVERGAPDYATRRSLYAGRIGKAYRAARETFTNPDLRRSASEWCARWSSRSESADHGEGMKLLREECAHWPAPTPPPAKPGGEDRTSQASGDKAGPSERSEAPSTAEAEAETETETESKSKSKSKPRLPPPQAVDPARQRLLLGGRVTLGLGGAWLLVAMAGAIRKEQLDRELERAHCSEATCPGLHTQSERSQAVTIAALVVGTALAGTGVALTILAFKRPSSRVAIAPALHPQLLGVGVRGSF